MSVSPGLENHHENLRRILDLVKSLERLPEPLRYEAVAFHLLQQAMHPITTEGEYAYFDENVAGFLLEAAFRGVVQHRGEPLEGRLWRAIARMLVNYGE